MFDLPQEHDIAELSIYRPKQKILVAATDGRGFVVNEDDLIAQTRNGKQVLNVQAIRKVIQLSDLEGRPCRRGCRTGNYCCSRWRSYRMSRGRGDILQRYKDGGLEDAKTFKLEDGLT